MATVSAARNGDLHEVDEQYPEDVPMTADLVLRIWASLPIDVLRMATACARQGAEEQHLDVGV